MSEETDKAHRFFSAHCFNEVWGLLEKPDRSVEDDRLMREMAHASLFHWLQRDDATPTNLSVGLWQVSRVYSVLNHPVEAMNYAEECLELSELERLSPFCLGYAHEAVARAAKVGDDGEECARALERARECLARVEDAEERSLLEADLAGLGDGA